MNRSKDVMDTTDRSDEGIRRTLRLAENGFISVDLCPCGTMALRVGAVSLHLSPEVVSSLLSTLGLAVARHQQLRASFRRSGRGGIA
jgi:hypothetical protein